MSEFGHGALDTHHYEEWVKGTSLYRDWEEKKAHVNVHKWLESEKAGHDIGWDHALVDWMIRHGWRHRRVPAQVTS